MAFRKATPHFTSSFFSGRSCSLAGDFSKRMLLNPSGRLLSTEHPEKPHPLAIFPPTGRDCDRDRREKSLPNI
jgi:hypothetical protein